MPCPLATALLKRIQELSGETVATSRVQRAGGLLFFQQRPLGADNFKLFVRAGGAAESRVLVDPTALSSSKSHMSLDWWRASPDGKYVVYGLSKDGSEDSLLHVLKGRRRQGSARNHPQHRGGESFLAR